MDVYNFIFIGWGYQLMVMSIDNLLLALVIFALEIVEFKYHKSLCEKEGSAFNYKDTSASFLKLQGEKNVMSGAPDDSSMMYLNNQMSYIKEKESYLDLGEESISVAINGKNKFSSSRAIVKTDEAQILEKLIRRIG